jgi:hypothetical protein
MSPLGLRADAGTVLDVARYRGDVEKRILQSTKKIPKDSFGTKTMVHFQIFRDGSVHNLGLTKRSNSAVNDLRALREIEKLAPFPALPKDSSGVEEFHIETDYNAHTWESKCEPASLELYVDTLLSQLARVWVPPHQKTPATVQISFVVSPEGVLSDVVKDTQAPMDESDRSLYEYTLRAAKSIRFTDRIPPNINIDCIRVKLDYEPQPLEETKQPGHLIGDHTSGPGYSDCATGTITFVDPP